MKNIMLLLFSIVLSACSSTSELTKFYSLNLHDTIAKTTDTGGLSKTKVVVNLVNLAQFLKQDKLVMQVGDYEIYFAEYHRWAEPLENEITKLLIEDLNRYSETFQFVRMSRQSNNSSSIQLHIQIDKFHPTDSSKVFLTGDYEIFKQDQSMHINKSFNISESLAADGYLHSVEKLKQLVAVLSDQLVNSFNESVVEK